MRVQYVQELFNESDGHADVSGVDPAPSQVDQLPSDVSCILATLNLKGGGGVGCVFVM